MIYVAPYIQIGANASRLVGSSWLLGTVAYLLCAFGYFALPPLTVSHACLVPQLISEKVSIIAPEGKTEEVLGLALTFSFFCASFASTIVVCGSVFLYFSARPSRSIARGSKPKWACWKAVHIVTEVALCWQLLGVCVLLVQRHFELGKRQALLSLPSYSFFLPNFTNDGDGRDLIEFNRFALYLPIGFVGVLALMLVVYRSVELLPYPPGIVKVR